MSTGGNTGGAGSAAFLDRGQSMNWSADEGLYHRYKIWKQQCELLFTGPMLNVEEKIQCKYLLFWTGARGLELFNSWGLTDDEQKILANYWTRFEQYVKPQSNELMAAWELHQIKQCNLSLEEFIAKLRVLVREACYPDQHHDRFLRDFLVFGMKSDRVRKECLKEGNKLTLEKTREMAKAEESADQQLQRMGVSEDIHAIHKSGKYKQNRPYKPDYRASKQTGSGARPKYSQNTFPQKAHKCRSCGGNAHAREHCPARSVTCHYCHKIGHYAKSCFARERRKVHEIEMDRHLDDNSDVNQLSTAVNKHLFLGPIGASPINADNINLVSCKDKATLGLQLSSKLRGRQLNVLSKIDSGAETNIIPIAIYRQIFPRQHKLHRATVKLSAYGGTEIPNLGSCIVYVQGPSDNNPRAVKVEVANVNGPAIIGNTTAQNLNLLKLNWPITVSSETDHIHDNVKTLKTDNQISAKLCDEKGKEHPLPLTKDYLLKEYHDVFTGIGCFPGSAYHIKVDASVPAVQHAPRQVPVHLQDAYKEQLEKLTKAGILREVRNEYTPWINSVVITSKPNGSIRLCLDLRDLNKALIRNPYYVRTIDDVIPKISGASHFSILDARNGFWQVKLDDESSKLCTFSTPWGKYSWTRLPFGLNISVDIFQEKMDMLFGDLKGVSGIADDTFVHGNIEFAHDKHIINVLDTARQNNVKFNPDKFQFKVAEASFFGHVWTPAGLRPDPKKIQAITNMSPPTNLQELQSLMGMVNYLNCFSPVLAQASEPLRQLMKKDSAFVWEAEQSKALHELKSIITKSLVLAYYDPDKDTVIQADASLKGLGCVLMQSGKPVCYASRSLTDAESRYSNIERELLVSCWSLERFHHYIYGKRVIVETDHKPLESIWKKSIGCASPRLQRLLLKMAKYDIEIRYIQGKHNVVADALSHVGHMETPTCDTDIPVIDVSTITSTLPATPARLDDIRTQTNNDAILSHLKDMVFLGWPEYVSECPSDLKDFWNFREDLSVENGLILKGHRIVIPKVLQPQMLNILHQGHLGTDKCLLKAKECLFWPGISKDIKKLTTECATCLEFSKKQSKEPLHPHNIPSYPWQKLGSDLFDYKGNQYLLIADYYSKFPIIRKLDTATSSTVINHLKSIFAEYAIPDTIVSDNGPQYSSHEFASFCQTWGIRHITSSPQYPQSNGFSERMVQTVKNLLKKSEKDGQDPYLALLAYRTTPVDSKLPSPSKLLNQRVYRTQLPASNRLQCNNSDDSHIEQLQERQAM